MRFILLIIVLGFPVIDLYATVRFARWTGVPVWGWLLMSFIAGAYLLRNERMMPGTIGTVMPDARHASTKCQYASAL